MPTYDYRCSACSHEFEQFQSIKDRPLRTCPKCGKKTLERLIGTGAAVLFKGSGFYQTDYRSESYKKGAEAETKTTSNGGADAKPESKPEAKPAASTPEKPAKKEPKKKSAPGSGA